MNCVAILITGEANRSFRIKFITDVDQIDLDPVTDIWRDDKIRMDLARKAFGQDCKVYEDSGEALLVAHKMVEDLGSHVTNGIYEIRIKMEY